MPRLIECCDLLPEDGPVLDSQAFWIRMPDGTRARHADGKLLAFKYRENAAQQAELIDIERAKLALPVGAHAVPPERHCLSGTDALVRQSPRTNRKRMTDAGVRPTGS